MTKKLLTGLFLVLVLLPAWTVRAGDESPQQIIETAKEMSLRGQFANSRRLYQRVIDEFPPEVHDQALFWLSFAYEAEGRTEQAVPLYGKLAKDHPRSLYADDALLKLAGIHRRAGDHREMAAALRALVKGYPDSPFANEAYLELGDLFGYELNQFDEAVAAYRNYRPSDPARAEANWKIRFFDENKDFDGQPLIKYFMSVRLLSTEAFDEAEATLKRLIVDYPRSMVVDDALVMLGRVEVGRAVKLRKENPVFGQDVRERFMGHYRAAADYFHQVVRDYPESPAAAEGLFHLGMIYDWDQIGGLNDFDRARKEYRRVVKNYPGTYWAQKAGERLELLKDIF